MSVRSRSWCFTINNPDLLSQGYKQFCIDLEGLTKYAVIGIEVGESGTQHIQGYMYLENAKTLTAIKKLNDFFQRAHLEIAKGTPLQASDYCKKDKNFTEYGTIPKQGTRTDLDEIKDLVNQGKGMRDIVDVATSYQSVKMAEVLLKYKEKPRAWKPSVIWFYGATGTGKSKKAYELMPDAYTCMSTGKWFEGYDAHEDVIIDDMRKDFMKFHDLLRFIDRYEMRIETKGGSRQFVAKRIIITSCYHPKELFETREDIQQLLRRIDEIEEFV